MSIKTILALFCTLSFLVSTVPVSNAAPPVRQANEVFWWWGDPAGTSSIVRTNGGISGNLSASLSNDLDSAKGLAVTLWIVVFNEPGECATVPCSESDLFVPAVKSDVLHGAGNVIGGSEKVSFGYHLKAGDNSGSIADLFGLPTDNGESWGLIDARAAEVHYVVRIHGPLNPEAMPDQIHTYGGGCIANAPFGYLPPTHPLDLFMGWGDCQDIMAAINLP